MADDLMQPPYSHEVHRAAKQMKSGKVPGADGLPPELFKHGGHRLTVFENIWTKREVLRDFKDALIIHIFQQKGGGRFVMITKGSPCCQFHARSWLAPYFTD